jgi:pimeloyl-ACP methyl ester carboxylesterase
MPRQGDDILGGVSFGGFVAYEVARILRPRGCVLISSVCSPLEMPPVMRACRPLAALGESFLASIGALATSCPRRLRSGSTSRLRKLAGERGRWRRWATSAVLGWRPVSEPFPCPVLQIHGSADATFPHRYTRPDVTISRGGHIIALTHPTEVAAAIRGFTHSLGVEVADR